MVTQSPMPFVLYVDDDSDDILLMKQAFERYPGVELVCFEESYKFLKYIINSKPFKHLPSLILIDINMPLLNGRELLTMLRSYDELKKVKMVLYTTSNLSTDNQFAKSLNAGFITKPVGKNHLEKTIEQLLRDCKLLP